MNFLLKEKDFTKFSFVTLPLPPTGGSLVELSFSTQHSLLLTTSSLTRSAELNAAFSLLYGELQSLLIAF